MRRRLHEKSDNKFSLSTPAVKATSTWRLQPLFNSGRRRSLSMLSTLLRQSICVHALELPRARCRARRAAARKHGGAAHQPEHYLSAGVVEPEDVAESIAVVVAGLDNRPG